MLKIGPSCFIVTCLCRESIMLVAAGQHHPDFSLTLNKNVHIPYQLMPDSDEVDAPF